MTMGTATLGPDYSRTQEPRWLQKDRAGVWISDEHGKKYLSMFCAGGTFNLGFNALDVRSAVLSLIEQHDAGMWPLPSERRDEAESQFASILPQPLTRTYFVASAAEAFEVACKFAKRITGRQTLVSATGGYHGHVGFSLAMDDDALPPYTYAPLAGGVRKSVYGSIESLSGLVDDNTAAVCLEAIQIPGGVVSPPEDYLAKVRRLCDERGALLILDEVQGGLCRTGKLWAFAHYDIVPDFLVTGKGITGGYFPCGALSYRGEYGSAFSTPKLVHTTSYAGNEIGSRLAGILAQRYSDPALCIHVNAVGARLSGGLKNLLPAYSDILEPILRGRGLIYAIEAKNPLLREKILAAALQSGIFLRGSSMNHCAIHFQPPLIITHEEVDEALDRFERALALVTKT
ncbi:MAG: hypothetical protein DCC69_03550 [Hyphomicrobiales bacterium]|nr:MAG: hypothetical protein DCC69_03550 [Hyphomicrobiales bacterium]